jgi:hypothetical protein
MTWTTVSVRLRDFLVRFAGAFVALRAVLARFFSVETRLTGARDESLEGIADDCGEAATVRIFPVI